MKVADIIKSKGTDIHTIHADAIEDVMTARGKLVVCDLDDDIDSIMGTMTTKRIRHLPVVDRAGAFQGIISVGDVINILLTHKDHEIRYLNDYIENKYPV